MTRKINDEKVEKKASSYSKKQPQLQKIQQRPRPKSTQLKKLNLSANLQKRSDSLSFCEYSLPSSSTLSSSAKKLRVSRTASSKRKNSTKVIKKNSIIPEAKKKLYYFNAVNGDELINQSLQSMGWERTDDKNNAECKLEWHNERDPPESALPRDNDKLLHQLPRSKLLTTKSGLLTCLREYDRIMSREREYSLKQSSVLTYTDFFPESYRLDHKPEREAFCAAYRIGDLWVSSPIKLLNAKDAYFIRDQEEVNSIAVMKDTQDDLIKKWPSGVVLPRVNHRYTCLTLSRLVQKYATNPLLLNGKRFVVRTFMMITCSQPLVVFYHPGYCMLYHKVAIEKMTSPDLTLQNYVVWSMQKLNNFVNQHYAETEGLCRDWVATALSKRCQRIMLHCLNAARNRLNLKRGYFDLIGCDFLIKDDFSVTLLEMKSNPALFTGCKTLKELMPSLVSKLLSISIECFEKAMKSKRIMPLEAEHGSCVLLYNDDFYEKMARKEEMERKAKKVQDLADRKFREEEQAARLSKISMRPLDLANSNATSDCEDESGRVLHPYLRRVHRRLDGVVAPEYYTDLVCEHIDRYLTSLGWRRTYDNNNVDYKLKWCVNRIPTNYALFREREQLLFQLPNARLLTTKTGLLKSLQLYDRVMSRVRRFSLEVVLDYRTFFPESYDMEDERDCAAFFAAYRPGDLWISKPSNSSQGRGIHLVRNVAEFESVRRLASESLKERCYQMHQLSRLPYQRLLQRYITNPLLIEGRKFDVRNYMLITCACPQVVFFKDGYCRLSCNKYDVNSSDLCVHLTNQSVQRKSPCYASDETIWSMERLNDYVNEHYAGKVERDWVTTVLPKRCQEILLHCFNAVRAQLECKLGYFDLIGCDFLIHDDFSVSLIEMTSSPAMGTYTSVLQAVIPELLTQFLAITIESFDKVSKGRPVFPLSTQHDCTLLFRDHERSSQYMLSSPDDRKSFHRSSSTAWR